MKILKILIAILFITVCLTACSGSSDVTDKIADVISSENEIVLSVKEGTNSNYPGITYGEAFDSYFGSPTWKYVKGTNTGTDEVGQDSTEQYVDIVEFTGYCIYKDVEVKASIQFTINNDDTFTASSLSFNDVPQDMLMLVTLLDDVFSTDKVDTESAEEMQASDWVLISGETSGIINDCLYTIDELKVVETTVYVTCTFTNNQTESRSHLSLFHELISQKGVECVTDHCEDQLREVLPGSKFTLTYSATLSYEKEPITVNITGGLDGSGQITAVYALKDVVNSDSSDTGAENTEEDTTVASSEFDGEVDMEWYFTNYLFYNVETEIGLEVISYDDGTLDFAFDGVTAFSYYGNDSFVDKGIIYYNCDDGTLVQYISSDMPCIVIDCNEKYNGTYYLESVLPMTIKSSYY